MRGVGCYGELCRALENNEAVKNSASGLWGSHVHPHTSFLNVLVTKACHKRSVKQLKTLDNSKIT